jgi:hypothetical protein
MMEASELRGFDVLRDDIDSKGGAETESDHFLDILESA